MLRGRESKGAGTAHARHGLQGLDTCIHNSLRLQKRLKRVQAIAHKRSVLLCCMAPAQRTAPDLVTIVYPLRTPCPAMGFRVCLKLYSLYWVASIRQLTVSDDVLYCGLILSLDRIPICTTLLFSISHVQCVHPLNYDRPMPHHTISAL